MEEQDDSATASNLQDHQDDSSTPPSTLNRWILGFVLIPETVAILLGITASALGTSRATDPGLPYLDLATMINFPGIVTLLCWLSPERGYDGSMRQWQLFVYSIVPASIFYGLLGSICWRIFGARPPLPTKDTSLAKED